MTKATIETSIEVLEETLAALRSCTQPFDCNPDCPFYKEASFYRVSPLAYCQGRMAGHVSYVIDKLKEVEA